MNHELRLAGLSMEGWVDQIANRREDLGFECYDPVVEFKRAMGDESVPPLRVPTISALVVDSHQYREMAMLACIDLPTGMQRRATFLGIPVSLQ